MPCPKHPRCNLLHWRTRHAVSLQVDVALCNPSSVLCTLYSVICHLYSVHFLPLRQGVKRVFRGMTECHSVPSEGSTPQCDVGQTRRGRGYDINGKRKTENSSLTFHSSLHTPSALRARPPDSEGQSWWEGFLISCFTFQSFWRPQGEGV